MEARRMGAFIKALRKEKNLTQEQLGEALFVSSKTVSRWETGNSLPDLMMLQNIADFFHVDIRELIDGERFPESSPAEIETVRKMAEYSRSKEKKMSRKLWLTFALILLVKDALNSLLPDYYIEKADFGTGSIPLHEYHYPLDMPVY